MFFPIPVIWPFVSFSRPLLVEDLDPPNIRISPQKGAMVLGSCPVGKKTRVTDSFCTMLSWRSSVLLFAAASLPTVWSDSCQPHNWKRDFSDVVYQWKRQVDDVIYQQKRATGDIVCRYWATTPAQVNYYTCTQLAVRFQITIEDFFFLNPAMDRDCATIQPNTDYCVKGCM